MVKNWAYTRIFQVVFKMVLCVIMCVKLFWKFVKNNLPLLFSLECTFEQYVSIIYVNVQNKKIYQNPDIWLVQPNFYSKIVLAAQTIFHFFNGHFCILSRFFNLSHSALSLPIVFAPISKHKYFQSLCITIISTFWPSHVYHFEIFKIDWLVPASIPMKYNDRIFLTLLLAIPQYRRFRAWIENSCASKGNKLASMCLYYCPGESCCNRILIKSLSTQLMNKRNCRNQSLFLL
jgi:hypothetical protein